MTLPTADRLEAAYRAHGDYVLGKVAKVFPKVSPKTHDEVVLKALGELAAA